MRHFWNYEKIASSECFPKTWQKNLWIRSPLTRKAWSAPVMDGQYLVNLIKSKTYFKGAGSCIDLILTNRKHFFRNTSFSEIGLSRHHHLIYSVTETAFKCEGLKKLIYRIYLNFIETYNWTLTTERIIT